MTAVRDPGRRALSVAYRAGCIACRDGLPTAGARAIPEEMPVAFVYEGASYAVMMATPADLEDFAVGFSLTEQLIASAGDIESLEILPQEDGVVLRMALSRTRAEAFWQRRRRLAGPSGCGLCGIESIAQAMRGCAPVSGEVRLTPAAVRQALKTLAQGQRLNRETRAVHAAGFWHARRGLVAVREDVGRHNALDKLAGALARDDGEADAGAVLLTSRVSVEMVQKTAAIGAPILIAMSAPTALAVRVADAAGITLAAIARDDGFEIFTHPRRFGADALEAAAVS